MGVKCAKCGESMDGVVTQDTLRERLAAKDEQITALREEAKEVAPLRAKLAEGEAARKELAELRAERVRGDAFKKHAISDDPKVRDRLWRYYTAETAGQEDAPEFDAWLDSPDTRALFAAHYRPPKGTAAGATGGAADAPGRPGAGTFATKVAPKNNAASSAGELPEGAVAKGTGFPTSSELAKEFASPEFQRLPPKERLAKIAEKERAWKESRAAARRDP